MENFEKNITEKEIFNFKSIIIILVFVLIIDILLSINIGYAYEFNDKENISTANINGRFEMFFENALIKYVDEQNNSNASIKISNDMKELYVNAGELKYPGAKVEYQVDIVNYSTVSAKIESIECKGLENAKAIKIEGLENLNESIVLNPLERYKLSFIIKWDEEYNDEINEKVDFFINVNFIQDI